MNVKINYMNYVKAGWDKIKNNLNDIDELYSFDETYTILIDTDYYKTLYGKSKNRTLIKCNPKLYKSIYYHSYILEKVMKEENKYFGNYSFSNRIKFIVEHYGDINSLLCQCGSTHNWTKFCRKCPEPKKTWLGRTHTSNTKKKQRISTLEYLKNTKAQISPRYNIRSIELIENYAKMHNLNFQHAENGGEFHIKELGYFLDAYDSQKNVVLEIDESHHYKNGKLRDSDILRQKEIVDFLKCDFIRIKI